MSRKSRRAAEHDSSVAARPLETAAVDGDDADADAPSRTKRKHQSEELQQLGDELVALRAERIASLALPATLEAAIAEAKRLTTFGAKRRQSQFIGKLMRRLDAETLAAVRSALGEAPGRSAADTKLLHRAERWRALLLADATQIVQWLEAFPGTDAKRLRALIRQASRDARDVKTGETVRQGRAYREIFLLVRAQLSAAVEQRLADR